MDSILIRFSEPIVGFDIGDLVIDLNNDGWMDVVVTSLGGEPLVLLNHGGSGNWLSISLRGTRSNRDGLGASVQVNGQQRFATTGGV